MQYHIASVSRSRSSSRKSGTSLLLHAIPHCKCLQVPQQFKEKWYISTTTCNTTLQVSPGPAAVQGKVVHLYYYMQYHIASVSRSRSSSRKSGTSLLLHAIPHCKCLQVPQQFKEKWYISTTTCNTTLQVSPGPAAVQGKVVHLYYYMQYHTD